MFIANGAVFGGCEKGIIGGFHLPIFMSILLEMRSLPRPRFNRFFLGSGPGRGRSPVEWGDFPFVCSSVCLFPPLSHPARPGPQIWLASGLAGWVSGLAGCHRGGGDVWKYKQKISPFYRTLSPIRSAAQKNAKQTGTCKLPPRIGYI